MHRGVKFIHRFQLTPAAAAAAASVLQRCPYLYAIRWIHDPTSCYKGMECVSHGQNTI